MFYESFACEIQSDEISSLILLEEENDMVPSSNGQEA